MEVRPNPTSCEPPFVGFEVDKSKIMNALLDTSEQRRSVLHIVGPRGVGKTYLAKEIYTSAEVQMHFNVHIWLPVRDYIDEDKVLKHKMRKQLSIEDQAVISNFLRGKRYCVVIDLYWHNYFSNNKAWWSAILEELPDDNNGSRVLVTNKGPEYDECTGSILREYEVGPRNNVESLKILLKAAFPKDPLEGCPADKLDDMVMKCKGLPWPLRFLGGLLSERPWNEVLDRIKAVEAGGMSFVDFAMSYRGLPDHATRAAFLYFLTFPEGAEIRAKNLIHLLELEGISESISKGNRCLEVLAERSMIEVTKRYSDDSIKCCRLQTLLRSLAIHEAKEKRFVMINEYHSFIDLFDAHIELTSDMVNTNQNFGGKYMDVTQLADAICILNFGENLCVETSDRREGIKGSYHLKTLTVRDRTIKTIPSNINESLKMLSLVYLSLRNTKVREIPKLPELLKTLDVGGTPIETLPDSSSCPNLKTLLLRNTKVCEIPASFKKLQYLDVRDTFVRSLPISLWTNGYLKSILASNTLQHLDGPPLTAKLYRLETLETVHVLKSWGKKLPEFSKESLHKLGLSYFKIAFTPYNALNWEVITRLLSTLFKDTRKRCSCKNN